MGLEKHPVKKLVEKEIIDSSDFFVFQWNRFNLIIVANTVRASSQKYCKNCCVQLRFPCHVIKTGLHWLTFNAKYLHSHLKQLNWWINGHDMTISSVSLHFKISFSHLVNPKIFFDILMAWFSMSNATVQLSRHGLTGSKRRHCRALSLLSEQTVSVSEQRLSTSAQYQSLIYQPCGAAPAGGASSLVSGII